MWSAAVSPSWKELDPLTILKVIGGGSQGLYDAIFKISLSPCVLSDPDSTGF